MDLLGLLVGLLMSPQDHAPDLNSGPAVMAIECSKHWMHIESNETASNAVDSVISA